jgi:hypothetical protein
MHEQVTLLWLCCALADAAQTQFQARPCCAWLAHEAATRMLPVTAAGTCWMARLLEEDCQAMWPHMHIGG